MLIKFLLKKEEELKTQIDKIKKYSRLSATCKDDQLNKVYEVIFFIYFFEQKIIWFLKKGLK